jgi:hemoglobin/transferrin/lactoferrin receptor protein
MKHYLFLLLLLLPESFIYGQALSPDSIPHSLNEVIISTSKFEETRRTVPQDIQVITPLQIRYAQAQTTADLLSNTAGVFVQRSQMGGGSPVLRGFEASRILLVIDGVRMNNLIYRSGHLQNVITTDNNSLERVEVLFGPGSTMYGSDALGGVIHLYTRNPAFSDSTGSLNTHGNAFTRWGSVNSEKMGHLDFNIGGRRWASFTSITFSDFGDIKGGSNANPFYASPYGERAFYADRINGRDTLVKNKDRYRQVQSAYSQYDLLQKISFRQSDRLMHTLNLQFSNSSDVPRYDRLTDADGNGGLRFAEWYYGPQTRFMGAYHLLLKTPFSYFGQVKATASYQWVEESRYTRRFGNDVRSERTEQVNVGAITIDFLHLGDRHRMNLGTDVQMNNLSSTAQNRNIATGGITPVDTRYPDGDNNMTTFSLYMSESWTLAPGLTLTDGFRIGYSSLRSNFRDTTFFRFPFNEVSQNNLVYSGSIGLVHVPTDDLKFSALFSTGFRVPNVDDLAKVFESGAGTIVVPNEKIDPEQTWTGEIGITKVYDGRSSWENILFYTRFLDAIVVGDFSYQGRDSIIYDGQLSRVVAAQNTGEAYVYGFTSSYRARLLEDFRISLQASYTYGRIKTDSSDTPLDHIPPFVLRMGLEYTHGSFRSDFFVMYNGWKRLKDYNLNGEDNLQYATPDGMPAWMTLNWRVSYKAPKNITIEAGIDNLLDTQYRVFASGINGPGRNLFGVLRYSF